jgi:putative PIN family toxin of toxin-antitoxin system
VIRVVLDANVLVSAALARDPAAPSVRGFDALLDERIEAVGCPALLGEVAAVLGPDRLRRYLSLEEARRFVADRAGVMTLAGDPPAPYPAVCRDSGDDYLVALVRAALVDALATGDRDLLELEDIGVAVMTPRELVERLADAP